MFIWNLRTKEKCEFGVFCCYSDFKVPYSELFKLKNVLCTNVEISLHKLLKLRYFCYITIRVLGTIFEFVVVSRKAKFVVDSRILSTHSIYS